MSSASSFVNSPKSPTCRKEATIRCPEEYGNLFSRANASAPRWTTSFSSSSPAAASQKMQPSCSSACLMYSSRHGAQSCLVTRRAYRSAVLVLKILHVKRFVLFVALAAIASGAAAPSAQRTAVVPAGVGIGGIRLGGLSSEEARNAITWWYNRPLRFTFQKRHWTVRPAALGATVDADDAVAQALKARPTDHLSLRVNVDAVEVRRYVRALNGQLSIEPQDATVSLRGLQPVVTRGKAGLELDQEQTVRTIQGALALARRNGLAPSTRAVAPSVTSRNFGSVIVIYRGSNELHLYNGSRPVRTFQVATGQAIYPTPLGNWHIVDMQRNPWWRPPDSPWAKGLKTIT